MHCAHTHSHSVRSYKNQRDGVAHRENRQNNKVMMRCDSSGAACGEPASGPQSVIAFMVRVLLGAYGRVRFSAIGLPVSLWNTLPCWPNITIARAQNILTTIQCTVCRHSLWQQTHTGTSACQCALSFLMISLPLLAPTPTRQPEWGSKPICCLMFYYHQTLCLLAWPLRPIDRLTVGRSGIEF